MDGFIGDDMLAALKRLTELAQTAGIARQLPEPTDYIAFEFDEGDICLN